mmetsp:Transcript_2555/g.6126  ORF Transcript_2555/g.6126 Transcript_2555/m.6126 type:complete len:247 (+) Transcript_2555:284-1024(+)
MLDDLQESFEILSLKFKRGAPCGDVLHAILEGKDGSATVRTDARNRLQNIAAFVKLLTPRPGKRSERCQHCCKGDESQVFQNSLMYCSRCKEACYCSKACQIADWKNHKIGCVPNDKHCLKTMDVVNTIFENFMTNTTYFYLMTRMVLAIDETGMKLRDMVMELDFRADKDGIVPALQDPPCYTIVPKQAYFEAPGRSDIDIFDTTHGQGGYERIVSIMKEQHLTKTESCAFIFRYSRVFCLTPQT